MTVQSKSTLDPARPNLRNSQSSANSFHSRALAVSAAHRFTTHTSTSNLSTSPQNNAKGTEPVGPAGGSSEGGELHGPPNPDDLEANTAHTNGTSVNSTRPFLKRAVSNESAISSTSTNANLEHMHHGHKAPGRYQWLSGNYQVAGGATGDEPGVDVRSKRDEEAYSHLKGRTTISVIDYSSNPEDADVRADFDGDRLREWLDSDHGVRQKDENGKPRGVRWMHVNGLNWQVIKTLTLQYGLHPLSVEDALRATNSPRSKMDFYRDHLYLQILVQHMHPADGALVADAAEEIAAGHIEGITSGTRHADHVKQSSGAAGRLAGTMEGTKKMMRLPEGVEGVFEPSIAPSKLGNRSPYSKAAHRMAVDELSAKYMIPIRRSIISAFMTRDGTLITMSKRPIREVLAPIYARLEDEHSLLRRSGDVSMLTQALLDVSVDLAIEISQAFETEILKLEGSVLVDPSMETVRQLHVLSSQLIRLRRSLTPLLHVAYIIRDQDLQRSAAASAVANGPSGHGAGSQQDAHWLALNTLQGAPNRNSLPGPGQDHHRDHGSMTPARGAQTPNLDTARLRSYLDPNGSNAGTATPTPSTLGQASLQGSSSNVGFFTPLTKVYIGDVLDHLEIIVSSMDQFVATCDHLTDYVFNVLSFQTNASMERLSIVTVVFLPLTFIASYFGMNFDDFNEIRGPVSYFWEVAAPCTVSFFVIFSFSYLRAGIETLLRRIARWKRTRMIGSRSFSRNRSKSKHS